MKSVALNGQPVMTRRNRARIDPHGPFQDPTPQDSPSARHREGQIPSFRDLEEGRQSAAQIIAFRASPVRSNGQGSGCGSELK